MLIKTNTDSNEQTQRSAKITLSPMEKGCPMIQGTSFKSSRSRDDEIVSPGVSMFFSSQEIVKYRKKLEEASSAQEKMEPIPRPEKIDYTNKRRATKDLFHPDTIEALNGLSAIRKKPGEYGSHDSLKENLYAPS